MASPLTASGLKGSLLLIILLLLFSGISYHRLYVRNPSIISNFEQESFYSNFQVFRKAILHAHLHFQINQARGCKIDCLVRNSIGLDFNSLGYPISTRYDLQNVPTDPFISDITNNNSDCAQIWSFLMGPIHKHINTDQSPCQALFRQLDKSCVYRYKNLPESSIIYKSNRGTVQLLAHSLTKE